MSNCLLPVNSGAKSHKYLHRNHWHYPTNHRPLQTSMSDEKAKPTCMSDIVSNPHPPLRIMKHGMYVVAYENPSPPSWASNIRACIEQYFVCLVHFSYSRRLLKEIFLLAPGMLMGYICATLWLSISDALVLFFWGYIFNVVSNVPLSESSCSYRGDRGSFRWNSVSSVTWYCHQGRMFLRHFWLCLQSLLVGLGDFLRSRCRLIVICRADAKDTINSRLKAHFLPQLVKCNVNQWGVIIRTLSNIYSQYACRRVLDARYDLCVDFWMIFEIIAPDCYTIFPGTGRGHFPSDIPGEPFLQDLYHILRTTVSLLSQVAVLMYTVLRKPSPEREILFLFCIAHPLIRWLAPSNITGAQGLVVLFVRNRCYLICARCRIHFLHVKCGFQAHEISLRLSILISLQRGAGSQWRCKFHPSW